MLILASASPRRKQLLAYLPYKFEVIPSSIDENISQYDTPYDFASQLAEMKAQDVASEYMCQWVLGCDTIVHKEGRIFGKPKNKKEVFEMLESLSNSKHEVVTAFSLVRYDQHGAKLLTDFDTTEVYMGSISKELIEEYYNSGSPMDKAGAYGIQDPLVSRMVKSIKGDYWNVVGLPLYKLNQMLQKQLAQ